MRTIVRIIPSTLEKYFWNLVRIRNAFLLCTRLPDPSRQPRFWRRTAEVVRVAEDGWSPESASHRTMIYAGGKTARVPGSTVLDCFGRLHVAI